MLAGHGEAQPNDGALVFRRPATMSGAIELFGASAPIVCPRDSSGTISGAISGNTGLIKGCQDLLRLTGLNTYTGMTTIADGQLSVGHPQALGGAAAGTTLPPGAELHIDIDGIINEPLFAQLPGDDWRFDG